MSGEMIEVKPKITYLEYLCFPLIEPRYELIDGRLEMVPAPTPYHQTALLRLVLALERFVAERGLGWVFTAPCDVVFSEHNVLQPDIFFISEERRHIITEKNIWGAPDLVVEIISPSTEERDRIAKLGVYARYGVKEYWLVELEDRKVKVLRLGEGGYETAGIYGEEDVLESPLLEGLKVNLKGIFERL